MISVFGVVHPRRRRDDQDVRVGLAVAVLLDVTLVRMVLVPAAMSLLGHRAWWLPAWLERRLPRIDIEGGAHDGEEAAEPESQPAEPDRSAVLV